MSIKFEKLKEGMILYTVSKHRMGSTTIRTVSVHSLVIISVDPQSRTFIYSRNGNKQTTGYEHQLKRFRAKEPVLIRSRMGYARLATREEIKELSANE